MVNSDRQCRLCSSRLFSVLSVLITGATGMREKIEKKGKAQKNWKQRTGGRDETAIKIKKSVIFVTRGCARFNVWVSATPAYLQARKRRMARVAETTCVCVRNSLSAYVYTGCSKIHFSNYRSLSQFVADPFTAKTRKIDVCRNFLI